MKWPFIAAVCFMTCQSHRLAIAALIRGRPAPRAPLRLACGNRLGRRKSLLRRRHMRASPSVHRFCLARRRLASGRRSLARVEDRPSRAPADNVGAFVGCAWAEYLGIVDYGSPERAAPAIGEGRGWQLIVVFHSVANGGPFDGPKPPIEVTSDQNAAERCLAFAIDAALRLENAADCQALVTPNFHQPA
jgi:hypothetical protein